MDLLTDLIGFFKDCVDFLKDFIDFLKDLIGFLKDRKDFFNDSIGLVRITYAKLILFMKIIELLK